MGFQHRATSLNSYSQRRRSCMTQATSQPPQCIKAIKRSAGLHAAVQAILGQVGEVASERFFVKVNIQSLYISHFWSDSPEGNWAVKGFCVGIKIPRLYVSPHVLFDSPRLSVIIPISEVPSTQCLGQWFQNPYPQW